MKSRKYNSKIAREIHLGHAGLININTSDRQTAPNWQRKTMKLPHVTMSRCIATPCWDWFRLYSMERYIKCRAATVLYSIRKWLIATVRNHHQQHLLETIIIDRGCYYEAIAVTKSS